MIQPRDAIESALMQEAIEDDQVILAQRALVARKTPAEFVELLYVDNKALIKWHEHTIHGHLWTVLAHTIHLPLPAVHRDGASWPLQRDLPGP